MLVFFTIIGLYVILLHLTSVVRPEIWNHSNQTHCPSVPCHRQHLTESLHLDKSVETQSEISLILSASAYACPRTQACKVLGYVPSALGMHEHRINRGQGTFPVPRVFSNSEECRVQLGGCPPVSLRPAPFVL